jgi:hypothetical protein
MSPETQVIIEFGRFRDALAACDTTALDSLLSEGYRGYNLQGHLENRDVVLEAYAPGAATLEVWEISDLRVEVFSEVALLSGQGFVAGTWHGRPWSHHLRFCDSWVRTNGTWRIHLSMATPMELP